MKILTEKDSKKMKNNKPTYKKLQKDNKRLRNVINLYIKSKERTDYLELKWVKNPHGAISLEMDDSLCVDFNPSDEKYWTPNAIWYHQGDNGDGKFSSLEDAKKNAITWYVIDILKGMRVLKALNEQIDEHLIDKIKNDTAIMLEGKIKWLKYELDIQVRSRVDEARKDATYHRKIHEKTQKNLIDLNGLLDDIVETIEEKWHCTLCHGTGKFYKYTCDKEQIVCSWCKGAGVSKEASELIQKIKSMRELVAK